MSTFFAGFVSGLFLFTFQPDDGLPLPGEGSGLQWTPAPLEQRSEAEIDGEASEIFVAANRAYEQGDYRVAIRHYGALLERGLDHGDLFYNLGNAYLRNGELGRAIAAYRHAQSRLPRDEDLAANLAFARKSTKDAIEPPSPPPLLRALAFWHYTLSRGELLRGTVILNVLLWGLLAWRLRKRGSEALRWAVMVVVVLMLACGGSLLTRIAAPLQVAVVVPQEIEALSGTGADAKVRFLLHAGTELRLMDRQDGWLRIALPDGAQGWVEEEHLEVIEI